MFILLVLMTEINKYFYDITYILDNNIWNNTIILTSCIEDEENTCCYINIKFNDIFLNIVTNFDTFCEITSNNVNYDLDEINLQLIYSKNTNILQIFKLIDTIKKKEVININDKYSDIFHFINKIESKTKFKLNFEEIKNYSKQFLEDPNPLQINHTNIPKELLLNTNQIFLLLFNEINKINNNFDYDHYIYPNNNNIYDLRLRLVFQKKNIDYLEFKITINPWVYPFYPPTLDVIYPKLKLELLLPLLNLNIFKLENWNLTLSLEWFLINIYNLINPIINDYIDITSEFTKMELLLISLTTFTKEKNLDCVNLNIIIPKLENTVNIENNKFWKAGTGYSNNTSSTWNIKNYIKEKNINDSKIKNILYEINKEITNDNINIFNNSCFYNYILNTLNGINLLSIETNELIIEQIIELLNTLFEYKDNLMKDFISNIVLNLTQLNEEIITLFQNNVSSQMNILFQSIHNIYEKYYSLVNNENSRELEINEDLNINKELEYETYMKTLQFGVCELPSTHTYYNQTSVKLESKSLMRIISEISSLKSSLPLNWDSSIWVRIPKNNMNIITFIISGPKDTPYQDGLFEFHAHLPPAYPNSIPKVLLVTTGNGNVRFNPNLYACGKVCLSLLGTWKGGEGEEWLPKTSTFLQVLVSIQSLIFIEDPYFNEPGHEVNINTPLGKEASDKYNTIIQIATIEWSIINQIKNPPLGFETIVIEHFKRKKTSIIETCKKWVNNTKSYKKELTNMYNNLVVTLNSL